MHSSRAMPIPVVVLIILLTPVRAMADNIDLAAFYAPYQQLLDDYLIEKDLPNDGLVSAFDYRAALADPAVPELLAEQRARLARFDPGRMASGDGANAFWLNAYNFFMIAHLLENPGDDGEPVDSVRDYGNFISPFRVFSRTQFTVNGRDYSLDEIEKEVLLGETFKQKGWWDARVHFAVNCASVGCPPLRSEVYAADNMQAYFEENTRRALATERHMHIDGNTLRLSELFDWYSADYVRQSGSVRAFLRAYTDRSRHDAIAATDEIDYIDYDWRLNSPENFPEFSD